MFQKDNDTSTITRDISLEISKPYIVEKTHDGASKSTEQSSFNGSIVYRASATNTVNLGVVVKTTTSQQIKRSVYTAINRKLEGK